QSIQRVAQDRWADSRGGDQRTPDEAKLGLVLRFGDAVRTPPERRKTEPRLPEPAYRQLLKIGCLDESYSIRLTVAQEIGAGGDDSFHLLQDSLDSARWLIKPPEKPTDIKKGKKDGNRGKTGACGKYRRTAPRKWEWYGARSHHVCMAGSAARWIGG